MGRHLTCAELASLLEGVASRDLIAEFLEHHLEVCEFCRDEYELSQSDDSGETSWQEVIEVATVLSAERAERLERLEEDLPSARVEKQGLEGIADRSGGDRAELVADGVALNRREVAGTRVRDWAPSG